MKLGYRGVFSSFSHFCQVSKFSREISASMAKKIFRAVSFGRIYEESTSTQTNIKSPYYDEVLHQIRRLRWIISYKG